jgi:hypothetical protein
MEGISDGRSANLCGGSPNALPAQTSRGFQRSITKALPKRNRKMSTILPEYMVEIPRRCFLDGQNDVQNINIDLFCKSRTTRLPGE